MKFYFEYRVKHSLFRHGLSIRCVLPFVAVLVLLLCSASVSSALVSGDASLSYTSYDGSADAPTGSGRNSMSSHSLVQNYSLLYSSKGSIYNNRVGRYDVALGYNWTALDTTFNSSTQSSDDYNKTRGHLLYRGEINLDPKNIPFKLNAYSRDMTRNTITNTSGRGMENFGSIFGYRDLATDINDGSHIESGVTLVAGAKNGMTNEYNEILRHFPMILLDYKDTINKDLRSTNPVNDRLSRLAFVSLNKKDNWFHYRHTQYSDYLDTSNNYVEDQIQLGTVDQNMMRRWVDFSNWLKVSTDLQFSKRKSNYQANFNEDFNLNFFVAAERSNWSARTFSTFTRYFDENARLSYQTALPLYAAGVVSRDISWNARTSFRENHDIDATGKDSRFISKFAGYRIDALKRSLFTLSQSFDVESAQSKTSDFLTLSGSLETNSTARFSRNVALGASYAVKNSSTTSGGISTSNSDFLEHNLVFHGGYAPLDTLRFDLRQTNTFTNGTFTSFDGTTRDSQTQLSQYYTPSGLSASDSGSKSYRSVSTLTGTWTPKPRFNANLRVSEDYFKSDAVRATAVTEVQSVVSYDNAALTIRNTFKFTRGSRETSSADAASVLSNNTLLRYIYSRNVDASIDGTYLADSSNGNTSRSISFVQKANYTMYAKSGVTRKLFEINETLTYLGGSGNTGLTSPKSLTLGFRYYPIRQLTLATGAGYTFSTSLRDYTLVWYASAAANFKLLQASLDFTHGIRKTDGARENKFTGNVRRSF